MSLKYEMPSTFTLRPGVYRGDLPLRDIRFSPLDYDRDGFTVELTVLKGHTLDGKYPEHGVLVLLRHRQYSSSYKLFCAYYDDALKLDQSEAWGKDYELVFDFLAGEHQRDLQADLAHNAKEHDEDLFTLKQKMRDLHDLLYHTRGAETISRSQLVAILEGKETD